MKNCYVFHANKNNETLGIFEIGEERKLLDRITAALEHPLREASKLLAGKLIDYGVGAFGKGSGLRTLIFSDGHHSVYVYVGEK